MLTGLSQVIIAVVLLLLGAGGLFGILHDMRENSAEFMNRTIVASPPSSDKNRVIASNENDKVSILYFPVNAANEAFIKGQWHIYNYIDENDREESVNAVVNLDLIGNSKVILDSDLKQIFRISFIGDETRMALIRKLKNGYEILEMKKIGADLKKKNKDAGKSAGELSPKGIIMADGNLVLEKVMNPARSNNIYQGQLVSGGLSLAGGVINNFDASVTYENGETVTFDFDVANINDGGQFSVDIGGEDIQGIFTNNGKDSYRIRFMNGPLAGALLNFIAEEKFEEAQEQNRVKEEESEVVDEVENDDREERAREIVKSKIQEQGQVSQQRSQQAALDNENLEEPNAEELSPEEMAEKVRQSGFDFGQAAPQPNEEGQGV